MSVDLTPFGLAVGHAQDDAGVTGLTVVRGIDAPFRCSATLLGRATGTRELDALTPRHLVDRVDAVLLTGGSAYGLGAADGVMRWMEERGRGFAVPGGVVPIVPSAVIFDLAPLGRFAARPAPALAYEACDGATAAGVDEGSVGAGTGATVGKGLGATRAMKGGFGVAVQHASGFAVAAMAVVNALGDVRDAGGRIIAGARAEDGGFADVERSLRDMADDESPQLLQNTTLAVVATTAALDRTALSQLASAASAALYRRITPTGTSFDGDVIFAISPLSGNAVPALRVETVAVLALEEAIERAVRMARGTAEVPGLADG